MTPKEQYEARKVERKARVHLDQQARERIESADILDMIDRFVTAAERIADALEAL
jgi:hypothetical protein